MTDEPQYMLVTMPFLFTNFVESQTRGQRGLRGRFKSGVKWVLNWKGARNR